MTGTVDTKHPDYLDRVDEWALMRDCARGETASDITRLRLGR